jgi:hypothetical protein
MTESFFFLPPAMAATYKLIAIAEGRLSLSLSLATAWMWEDVRPLQGTTAEELLQACFRDEVFLRAYHADQGHTNLELLPWHSDRGTSGARTLSFLAAGLIGTINVTEAVSFTLDADGTSLLVESRTKLSGGGPAARLQPLAQWSFANGMLTMRVEAVFVPDGYAERFLASTVQVRR